MSSAYYFIVVQNEELHVSHPLYEYEFFFTVHIPQCNLSSALERSSAQDLVASSGELNAPLLIASLSPRRPLFMSRVRPKVNFALVT